MTQTSVQRHLLGENQNRNISVEYKAYRVDHVDRDVKLLACHSARR